MAEKLIIVMANTDPRNGEELGAPIFQATVAAAALKGAHIVRVHDVARTRTTLSIIDAIASV